MGNDPSEAAPLLDASAPVSTYNQVFEKFVGVGEDATADIVGIVAYGIYKNAKREWATNIRTANARSPTESELQQYHSMWTPQQIQNARNSAQQTLVAYAEQVIADEEPRILKDALKGKFWESVISSITANAIYTIALIVLAVILAKAGVDLIGIIRDSAEPSAIERTQSPG